MNELNINVSHLSFEEQKRLIELWYERVSGLQSMHLNQVKEIERIHLANEMRIIEAGENTK